MWNTPAATNRLVQHQPFNNEAPRQAPVPKRLIEFEPVRPAVPDVSFIASGGINDFSNLPYRKQQPPVLAENVNRISPAKENEGPRLVLPRKLPSPAPLQELYADKNPQVPPHYRSMNVSDPNNRHLAPYINNRISNGFENRDFTRNISGDSGLYLNSLNSHPSTDYALTEKVSSKRYDVVQKPSEPMHRRTASTFTEAVGNAYPSSLRQDDRREMNDGSSYSSRSNNSVESRSETSESESERYTESSRSRRHKYKRSNRSKKPSDSPKHKHIKKCSNRSKNSNSNHEEVHKCCSCISDDCRDQKHDVVDGTEVALVQTRDPRYEKLMYMVQEQNSQLMKLQAVVKKLLDNQKCLEAPKEQCYSKSSRTDSCTQTTPCIAASTKNVDNDDDNVIVSSSVETATVGVMTSLVWPGVLMQMKTTEVRTKGVVFSKTPSGDRGTCNGSPASGKTSILKQPRQENVLEGIGDLENNCGDEVSLTFRDLQLNTIHEEAPSPAPSVNLDMQEFCPSPQHGGSRCDSPELGDSASVYYERNKQQRQGVNTEQEQQLPNSWTFYNNMLGQVNQMLQNAPPDGCEGQACTCKAPPQCAVHKKSAEEEEENHDVDSSWDTVRLATLKQIRHLGISFINLPPIPQRITPYLPRIRDRPRPALGDQIGALAMKYLKDEQINEVLRGQAPSPSRPAASPVPDAPTRHNLHCAHNYMKQTGLIKEQKTNINHDQNHSHKQPLDRILDITALKQQPKLL